MKTFDIRDERIRAPGRQQALGTALAHQAAVSLLWNAAPDSTKPQRELGWRPTRFEEGVRRTLADLGL